MAKEEKKFYVADLSKKLGTNDLRTRNVLRAIDAKPTDNKYQWDAAGFEKIVGQAKAYIDRPRKAPPVKAKGPNNGEKTKAAKETGKAIAKVAKETKDKKAAEKVKAEKETKAAEKAAPKKDSKPAAKKSDKPAKKAA